MVIAGAVLMPNKMAADIDKAQSVAAQHALRQLGVHFDGITLTGFVGGLQLAAVMT